MDIRINGIVPVSFVNGEGSRSVVFVQGCPHHCPGCHNPHTHDPCGGTLTTTEEVARCLLHHRLLDGITLSGGEPFDQPEACLELAKAAHASGKNVWAFSGYTFEQLCADERKKLLLQECDFLVDGPFIQARRSPDCVYAGSTNQRIINIKNSMDDKEIVLWKGSCKP